MTEHFVVNIDPIALNLGVFAIRWYSLAYIVAFIVGYSILRRQLPLSPGFSSPQIAERYFTLGALMAIVGGRLGEVLFYNPAYYWAHPLKILYVWEGGMSFHGGFLGVIAVVVYMSRREHLPLSWLSDCVSVVAPFGLMIGRGANFINGELWGKPTDAPWGMIFPRADDLPRHPSQLYEAASEGLLLTIVLLLLSTLPNIRARLGLRTGIFFLGYGLSRFLIEFVREPDSLFSLLGSTVSVGQLLSTPMIAIGLIYIGYALSRPPSEHFPTTCSAP